MLLLQIFNCLTDPLDRDIFNHSERNSHYDKVGSCHWISWIVICQGVGKEGKSKAKGKS